MYRYGHILLVALTALPLTASGLARAADVMVGSAIGGNSFNGVSGGVAVNVSAGDLNQQFNGASVARNDAAGSVTAVTAEQVISAIGEGPQAGFANIGDQAFASAAGLIRINQASGFGNLQANGVAIALGGQAEVVADVALAQSRADSELPPGSGTGSGVFRSAVSDTAFQGTQGIVQVNQAAGSGNASANALALRFFGGALQ